MKKDNKKKKFSPLIVFCLVKRHNEQNQKFVNQVYPLLNIPTSVFLCPFELHESYIWAAD